MKKLDPAEILALQKYGVGQPVARTEDPVLLRGEGNYCDDDTELTKRFPTEDLTDADRRSGSITDVDRLDADDRVLDVEHGHDEPLLLGLVGP